MPKHSGLRKMKSTGKAKSTKGSHHPDSISSGREMTDQTSGPSTKRSDPTGGGTGKRPSGVRSESGTENKKVKKKVHTSLPQGSPPGGSDDRKPSGVRSHDGKSAPKSVK